MGVGPQVRKVIIVFSGLAVLLLIFILLFVFLAVGGVEGREIDVDADGHEDYTHIQDAINASEDGDIINIHFGDYHESITVNRSITLIGRRVKSFVPTIRGSEDNPILVNVTADNVTITKLYIEQDVGDWDSVGLMVWGDNCNISGNVIDDVHTVIRCVDNNNTTIANNSFGGTFLWYGIELERSNNNSIMNNSHHSFNKYIRAITVTESSDNSIRGNTFRNYYYRSIIVYDSNRIDICDNVFTNASSGTSISITSSDHIAILNNTFPMQDNVGIFLSDSTYCTLKNNSMGPRGIEIEGTELRHWNTHDIDASNTMNGSAIHYIANRDGFELPSPTGLVFIVNSTNIVVSNHNLSIYYCYQGVVIAYSSNVTIRNGIYSDLIYRIRILESQDCSVKDCWFSSTEWYRGIFMRNSREILLRENYFGGCRVGVEMEHCSSSFLVNNTFGRTEDDTILMHDCTNITILGNSMENHGISIEGDELRHWNTHTIDPSNTIGILPIWYLRNQTDHVLNMQAGQYILVNCTDIRLIDLEFGQNSGQLDVAFCSGVKLENVTFDDCERGLFLTHSENTTIDSCRGISVSEWTIRMEYAHSTTIMDCEFMGSGDGGVLLGHSHFNDIRGNLFHNMLHYGVRLLYSENTTIRDNDFRDIRSRGIDLGSSSNNSIIGNSLSSSYEANLIYLSGSHDNVIRDNVCENDEGDGIVLKQSDRNIIDNNTCTGGDKDEGIHLERSNWNEIHNNTCSNFNSGIRLDESCDNYVRYNTCEHNNDGLSLIEGSCRNSIGYNLFTLNYYGIGSMPTWKMPIEENVIFSNDIVDNELGGISLLRANNNTIQGNDCSKNNHGISLFGANNNTIVENFISSSRYIGISFGVLESSGVIQPCDHNSIIDNILTRNAIGLSIGTQSEFTIVLNNSFVKNTEYGLKLDGNATYTINASGNWWGSETGPYHSKFNPKGKGDAVSGNVTVYPWLEEGWREDDREEDGPDWLGLLVLIVTLIVLLALLAVVVRMPNDRFQRIFTGTNTTDGDDGKGSGDDGGTNGNGYVIEDERGNEIKPSVHPVMVCPECGEKFEMKEKRSSIRVSCPSCGHQCVTSVFK